MALRDEMDVWLLWNEQTNTHFHPEVEMDFVVSGKLQVTVKDKTYLLGKEDFILLNSGLLHSIVSKTPDTAICCVKISCQSIARMSRKESPLFNCCSGEKDSPKYHEIRKIFHELIYTQVRQPHQSPCLKQSVLYKLLDCLLENFQVDPEKAGIAVKYEEDARLLRIFQYVNQNLRYNVSLTDLAQKLYISKSTLSRFFKKETGLYFSDYVNQARLRYAMEELLYSEKSITKIAADCGFSTPSAFNKIFREYYGTVPTKYRESAGKQEQKREREPDTKLLEAIKRTMDWQEVKKLPDKCSVRTDMTKRRPFPKKWNKCMNIGSAYNLTIANLQYHTVYLKEQLGFLYARIWSIFSRKLMICDGKMKGCYNYDKLDVVLDFLVSNHIRPFLDFGNRPDTAVYAPGIPVFDEKEYIAFESKEVWQDLMKDFILHIVNRYGEREVSGWVFEFSRDSIYETERNYYADENYSYFEVFQFAWKTIKTYLPKAKVGGPMGELEMDYESVSEFLENCYEHQCKPDFISFMLFPYHTRKKENGIFSERATNESLESEQVEMMRRILCENHGEGCKLYITEWNNTLSNRNYLNDSCFRGAYIAKKVSEIADHVDLLSIWMASDWMSSYYDTAKIANGGSGLLTKDSIRKPAYFVLQFLNMMGTWLIDKGENYMITESSDGSYYILCFHYQWYGAGYFVQDEDVKDPERIKDIFEDGAPLEIDFCLDHITPDSEFIVKRRTISEESGSILAQWKSFQYDRKLRSSDIRYIRESCFPKMSMERMFSKEGKLKLCISLLPHETSLIHIYEE